MFEKPKLTRTIRARVPGYEESYTTYMVTEDGTMHAFGMALQDNMGAVMSSVPTMRFFDSYEIACAAVDSLIENRLEPFGDYGPAYEEVARFER